MSIPAQDLSPEFAYGKVMGRLALAVGDTSDEGELPDEKAAVGKVTISPKQLMLKVQTPVPTTVISQPIPCPLDSEGYITDPDGTRGVWLIAGAYRVTYDIAGVTLQEHDILVTSDHTDLSPLWLTNAQPPGPAVTTTQYAELSARIDALAGGGGATTLDGLSDVSTSTATSGEALVFDGAGWVPGTAGATTLDGLSDVSTGAAVAGEALVFDGAGWVPGAAAPQTYVETVNGQSGVAVLDATSVGAIPAGDITLIEVMTQAEYDALPVKVSTTLYVIQG